MAIIDPALPDLSIHLEDSHACNNHSNTIIMSKDHRQRIPRRNGLAHTKEILIPVWILVLQSKLTTLPHQVMDGYLLILKPGHQNRLAHHLFICSLLVHIWLLNPSQSRQ